MHGSEYRAAYERFCEHFDRFAADLKGSTQTPAQPASVPETVASEAKRALQEAMDRRG